MASRPCRCGRTTIGDRDGPRCRLKLSIEMNKCARRQGGPRRDNDLAGEISRESMATMPDTGTVVAVAQLALAVGELDANRQAARAAVAKAAAAGARLVVLPELSDSGYVFSDADEAR